MTGLDCLREELKNRGLPKTQIESRGVAMTLDILANSGDHYTKMWQDETELTEKVKALKSEKSGLEREVASYERKASGYRSREASERLEYMKYIKTFFTALEECETEEGRDALKKAQMFVNTVSVDTKYDNTAFIIGLSAILSNGKVGALSELKKINKSLMNGFEHVVV